MAHILRICFLGLCGLATAGPAAAQQEMGLGPPPTRPFLSPDGSFAGKVPASWAARDFPHTQVVQFTIPGGGAAWVQVQRLQVPANAKPKQLLMRARETRLAKLPHFREFGQAELLVNGLRAASLSGDFWFQGNAEFPRAVEELFIVTGNEAFEIHFECFEPMVQSLRQDLTSFYMSFVAHPAAQSMGAAAGAGADDGGSNLQELMDRVPF